MSSSFWSEEKNESSHTYTNERDLTWNWHSSLLLLHFQGSLQSMFEQWKWIRLVMRMILASKIVVRLFLVLFYLLHLCISNTRHSYPFFRRFQLLSTHKKYTVHCLCHLIVWMRYSLLYVLSYVETGWLARTNSFKKKIRIRFFFLSSSSSLEEEGYWFYFDDH